MFELKACFILEREKYFPEECLVFLGILMKCSNIKNTGLARMYTQKTACQDNVTRYEFIIVVYLF